MILEVDESRMCANSPVWMYLGPRDEIPFKLELQMDI